jgi:class 3 adenylate cyclase
MDLDIDELCASLRMDEMLRLREALSKSLSARFGRTLALLVSEVADSAGYFERQGDEAGRGLQLRHFDLAQQAAVNRGRCVSAIGDQALLCFEGADLALATAIALQKAIAADNSARPRHHALEVRMGVHHGLALSDGNIVAGEAVGACARFCAATQAGEILLSSEAYGALLSPGHRLSCRMLPQQRAAKLGEQAGLMLCEWRDRSAFPVAARLENGEVVALPDKEVITFGRLREVNGAIANDIVLQAADPARNQQISRWHFELRRGAEGFVQRTASTAMTEVDGKLVAPGAEVPVRAGSVIRVARVLQLVLVGPPDEREGEVAVQTLMGARLR